MTVSEITTTVMGNQEFAIQKFQHAHFAELTTLTDNDGNIWFVGKEVAEKLGYMNPSEAVSDNCKYPKLLKGSCGLLLTSSPRGINIIPESDFYRMVMRSHLEKAEAFQDWVCEEVLPTLRKTGTYEIKKSKGMNTAEVECNMIALKYTIENLKPSAVSVIQMTKILYLDLGLKTNLLPEYVDNARVTFSASALIEKNNVKVNGKKLSAMAINKLLISAGYMEEKERPSSKGVSRFKALTETGLQYGINSVSVHNPREIQPHFFEDCFVELCSKLNLNTIGA